MSARSIRRARERQIKRESERRVRARNAVGLSAGVAAGATVLFAPAADASTFTVTNLNNDGAGSLRQAVEDANAATGDDQVTFQSGLSGTISLSGADSDIEIYEGGLSIQGPGASVITVDGGGSDRIFKLYAFTNPNTPVSISGLTLRNGAAVAAFGELGGALYSDNTGGNAAEVTIADAVLTGNTALRGGGAMWIDRGSLTITNSVLSGNHANTTGDNGNNYYRAGGAVLVNDTDGDQPVEVTIRDSQISGNSVNDADGGGFAAFETDGDILIEGSTITGNTAKQGGGIQEYGGHSLTIRNSTVSDNTAEDDFGGLSVFTGDAVTIEGSTFTGNRAVGDYAGGIGLGGSEPLLVRNTTISGNSAGDEVGGVAVYNFYDVPVTFSNSTIVGNTQSSDASAANYGAGLSRFGYDKSSYPGDDSVTLSSTIVAGNIGSADIADSDTTPDGSFVTGFSLIQNPGTALITESPAGSNLTGVDPQLGPLADNGGSTRTLLPAATSPAIDAGIANGLATDQRGLARTADLSAKDNAAGSDGTDIGAAEVQGASCQGAVGFADFRASEGNDTLSGSSGPDSISALGGNDSANGAGGKDCVKGDDGNDRVSGAGGKDKVSGGDGKDTVKGGGGKDKLKGNAGKDVIKARGGGKDKINCGAGKDKVKADAKDKVAKNCEKVTGG